MTLGALLIQFVPVSLILINILFFINFVRFPGLVSFLFFLFSVFFIPVLLYRCHNFFLPLQEGKFDIIAKKYNPWYGSMQFQLIFSALPFLEGILRIIPGFYSFWLRLWGAKVGKRVYWTPNITINDRTLIEIGNDCVFGHKCEFISHVISPRNNTMMLLVKRIKIGDDAFIGAASRFGPGVVIESGCQLPVCTDGQINQVFEKGNFVSREFVQKNQK